MVFKLAYGKLLTLHFIHLTHRSPFNIFKEMESTIIKMFERLTTIVSYGSVCSTVISINLPKRLFSRWIAVSLIETESERKMKRERAKKTPDPSSRVAKAMKIYRFSLLSKTPEFQKQNYRNA